MFSFERIAGLTVIERFTLRLPADESKIHSVMIGMAFRALLTGGIRSSEGGMQAPLIGNAVTDFRVAFETFQLRGAAFQIVALGTIRRPIQRLMRFRQRPRRNLRVHGNSGNSSQNAKNDEYKSASYKDGGALLNGLPFGRHRVSAS